MKASENRLTPQKCQSQSDASSERSNKPFLKSSSGSSSLDSSPPLTYGLEKGDHHQNLNQIVTVPSIKEGGMKNVTMDMIYKRLNHKIVKAIMQFVL